MDWAEAIGVLRGWEGRRVLVVPFLPPGLSVRILRGTLEIEDDGPACVRARVEGVTIALPRATLLEAGWVPGHAGEGLSIVRGGSRVDVFLDPEEG